MNKKNIYCYVNVNVYIYKVLSIQTIEDSTKNIHIVIDILKKLIISKKKKIHLFNYEFPVIIVPFSQ